MTCGRTSSCRSGISCHRRQRGRLSGVAALKQKTSSEGPRTARCSQPSSDGHDGGISRRRGYAIKRGVRCCFGERIRDQSWVRRSGRQRAARRLAVRSAARSGSGERRSTWVPDPEALPATRYGDHGTTCTSFGSFETVCATRLRRSRNWCFRH